MLVIDTTAAVQYTRGHISIGEVLAMVTEGGETAFLPAVCFAEAAGATRGLERELLNVLAGLPGVIVTPLHEWNAFEVGQRSLRAGSLGLAHAVAVAMETGAQVATADVKSAAHALPPNWPIVEV
jgi:hypothetical protein